MDPMTLALAGSIVAPIIGGIVAGGDRNQAMDLANQAAAQIQSLGLPPNLAKQIVYQQLQQGGQLTPELEGSLAQENFTPGNISAPTGDTTQLQATLSALKAQSQGGLTAQQMANQQQLLNQTNASTQAQNRGILQQQAEQGKSGSGQTLAAQLQGIQGGAQQNSQNALNIGAQGQQAQASALNQLLGGQQQLRGQDISTAAQNAQMQQAANIFKAQNASARQGRNVASVNAANQYNQNRANYTSDYNTQMANQEKLREAEAQRQYWLDQLGQRQGIANALTGQAQNYMNSAQNTQQSYGNIGQGLGAAGAAYGQYQNYQNRTNAMYPKDNSTMSSGFSTNEPYVNNTDSTLNYNPDTSTNYLQGYAGNDDQTQYG